MAGVSGRYDKQLRDARLYMSQPTLRHWPIETIASIYYTEERNPATEISEPFNVNRTGVSVQQERKLGNSYVWTYGYRYERAVTFDPEPGAYGGGHHHHGDARGHRGIIHQFGKRS